SIVNHAIVNRQGGAMWIRKIQRDLKRGVDSPMPTQVVSNEEFTPRPQNHRQKQVEHLIGEMAERNSKKLGMDRRAFMATRWGWLRVSWRPTRCMARCGTSTKRRRWSRRPARRSFLRASTS